MAAPLLAAAHFPTRKYPGDVYWRKSPNIEGKISREVLRTLYQRRCIEVANPPPSDLRNNIHPLFEAKNFPDLVRNEYDFLEPALKLASRLITDDSYMGFWDWICAGKPANMTRNNVGPVKEVAECIVRHPDYRDSGAVAIRHWTDVALHNLSDHLTFFSMDEDWSNGDFRVGEMFPDPHNRDCRKHQAKNRGRKCGTCMYCKCKATQVCPVCGDRWYMELRKRALRAHCRARGLRTPNGLTKQQLLDRLEVLNGSERPQPASAKTYKTTDEQRSKFQIGLHHDMLKHLRTYDSAGWSTAEELRFQFSVAVTLVHELTHVFWFNATERCWNCFDEDPYWHRNEDNFGEPKEIGNSWEYWAFGSRVPVGVRLTPQGSTETTNNFQRCQWNYIWSTKQVGRSDHPVIDHDFVLPVEYIHSWFREATWQRIATNGREAGRPNYAQAVFLREEPCGVDAKGEYKDYECTLENYNLAQLVAQGGYNHPGAARLAYGTKFDNNTKIKKHKKALIAKRDLCTCAGQP